MVLNIVFYITEKMIAKTCKLKKFETKIDHLLMENWIFVA